MCQSVSSACTAGFYRFQQLISLCIDFTVHLIDGWLFKVWEILEYIMGQVDDKFVGETPARVDGNVADMSACLQSEVESMREAHAAEVAQIRVDASKMDAEASSTRYDRLIPCGRYLSVHQLCLMDQVKDAIFSRACSLENVTIL